jgi:hypothetical protein
MFQTSADRSKCDAAIRPTFLEVVPNRLKTLTSMKFQFNLVNFGSITGVTIE